MASLRLVEDEDFRGWGPEGSPYPEVTVSGTGGPAKTGQMREYEDGRVPGRRRLIGRIEGTKGFRSVENGEK